MLSSLLTLLVLIVIVLLAVVIINMMDLPKQSESFLNILPDQTNEVPQLNESSVSVSVASSIGTTYMDGFKHVYQVDSSLLKNPLFADYYKNWWMPRVNGRYGDWKYRNPYWFPAKFDARPIRDSLSEPSKLNIIKNLSTSEYTKGRENDLKRLGVIPL